MYILCADSLVDAAQSQVMYSFPISALACILTGLSKERHCQDTFHSLTGTYLLGSLNRRPPCYFTINNILIHSPTGRIPPEQRVLVSTNEQCLLLSAHPRHRLMDVSTFPWTIERHRYQALRP
jgi:hypothetical protein